ncbi:hypothetical protein EDB80DRAFT_687639 [Ilyonectria destructans]|nr:hypothetical protein EDB80DRAFT_687639 [Ilyonectria destructans]
MVTTLSIDGRLRPHTNSTIIALPIAGPGWKEGASARWTHKSSDLNLSAFLQGAGAVYRTRAEWKSTSSLIRNVTSYKPDKTCLYCYVTRDPSTEIDPSANSYLHSAQVYPRSGPLTCPLVSLRLGDFLMCTAFIVRPHGARSGLACASSGRRRVGLVSSGRGPALLVKTKLDTAWLGLLKFSKRSTSHYFRLGQYSDYACLTCSNLTRHEGLHREVKMFTKLSKHGRILSPADPNFPTP